MFWWFEDRNKRSLVNPHWFWLSFHFFRNSFCRAGLCSFSRRIVMFGILLFIPKNHDSDLPSLQRGWMTGHFLAGFLGMFRSHCWDSRLIFTDLLFPNDQVLNEVLQGLSNDQQPTFALELLAQAQSGTVGSFLLCNQNHENVKQM